MTLYGSVGVLQHAPALMAAVQSSRITAVSRASQPRQQPTASTANATLMFPSFKRTVLLSYFLQNITPFSVK